MATHSGAPRSYAHVWRRAFAALTAALALAVVAPASPAFGEVSEAPEEPTMAELEADVAEYFDRVESGEVPAAQDSRNVDVADQFPAPEAEPDERLAATDDGGSSGARSLRRNPLFLVAVVAAWGLRLLFRQLGFSRR